MPGGLQRVIGALAAGDAAGPLADGALGRVAAIVADESGAPCALYVREPGTGELVARAAAGPADGPLRGLPVVAAGAAADLVARLDAGGPTGAGDDAAAGDVLRAVGDDAGALFPIRAGGRVVGALAAGPPALPWAPAVADALGLALGAERLAVRLNERAAALDRRVQQLDALAEVSQRVAVAADADAVAAVVAREARELVGADSAIMFERDGLGHLTPIGADGWTAGDPVPAVAELAGDGDEPVWMGRELAVGLSGGAAGDGSPRGLLVAARRGGQPFAEDDIGRLAGLARQAAVALDNARLVARLRRERAERDALAAALVDAQEEERRRVAEDIHDGPVQELVGVSLLLDALAGELGATAPARQAEAAHAAASARDALRALRRAIFDLHPMALEELGFAAAVRTLGQRLEWQGVRVRVDAEAAEALPAPLRTVAFRTCQEAMANVIRHAEAGTVDVVARADGGAVVVEVRDDGRGFDAGASGGGIEEGHLGLRALHERAALVGGALEVVSGEGRGTTVRLSLPGAAGP